MRGNLQRHRRGVRAVSPHPKSTILGGSEAARVREDIIVRTRHLFFEKLPVALVCWFKSCASLAGRSLNVRFELCKRATCSPFPMALCVRTNRPHAEICRIEGFFSTQPRSTFKPTHGKTPTSTTLRLCCALPRWRSIRPPFAGQQ